MRGTRILFCATLMTIAGSGCTWNQWFRDTEPIEYSDGQRSAKIRQIENEWVRGGSSSWGSDPKQVTCERVHGSIVP